ncbi:uncharacterized protein A4U43_C05F26580 [Asparagus officinalis]|uniref:Profilin n=1 Tax=Asparagus officinalis TaxID=4686 RepID=A0A5P1EVD2_ASPOF|nr:uncharacterized protein A4U43_C05F26580 [Asparagus officinalis]
MSWQSYIDDHLMCEIAPPSSATTAASGPRARTSLKCGLEEAALVCTHELLQIFVGRLTFLSVLLSMEKFKPEEISAIMNDFEEPGSLAPTGLFLGGTKYMVIQGEPGAVIRGKKGSGGVTVKKTSMALIVGIYDEPMTPGQCNMIVERLGDYLLEQNF